MTRWLERLLRVGEADRELFRRSRIVAGALAFSVLPFLYFGESWGQYWYVMNLPSSELLKDLWEWFGPVTYVAVATFCNWFVATGTIYTVATGVNALIDLILRGGPAPRGGPATRGGPVGMAGA